MADGAQPELPALEAALGYRFRDRGLLKEALRHRSHLSVQRGRKRDNQRLEFLGDRVLGLAVAADLLAAHDRASEGELHERFEALVCRASCAAAARRVGLGAHLALARNEIRSGFRDRDSVLADAMESVLAAVFLDGGLEEATSCVRRLFAAAEGSESPQPNPRAWLQEWSQGRGLGLPRYESATPEREAFAVRVSVGDSLAAVGEGSNKRSAERAAAAALRRQCEEQREETGAE